MRLAMGPSSLSGSNLYFSPNRIICARRRRPAREAPRDSFQATRVYSLDLTPNQIKSLFRCVRWSRVGTRLGGCGRGARLFHVVEL